MKLKWSPRQLAQVRALYAEHPTSEVARKVGRDEKSVYAKAYQLGLRKSPGYFAKNPAGRLDGVRGAGSRFKKGDKPWNAGTHYVAGGRSAETRFKPGERRGVAVKLWQPIGTERLSKDGYLQRKVNNDMPLQRRWKSVHAIVWEAANGPIPKGHLVRFLPGQATAVASEITVDKLELISRVENMRRNTLHRYPKEIALAIQLRGALNRRINKLTEAPK